jgi:hypothetical protein
MSASYGKNIVERTPGLIDDKVKVVKLYPNPSYNGSVTVSATTDDVLVFFLFDLEGKLLNQETLKEQKKVTISGLKKGTYMYNVFRKDESVEGGKIIVK